MLCDGTPLVTGRFRSLMLSNAEFDFFSCEQAAVRTLLPVRPSVRPSVTLFHSSPLIVSAWNFHELLPLSKGMSMQRWRSEVKGQAHRGQNPILTFPGCSSSLKSQRMMKWCKKAWCCLGVMPYCLSRSSVKFQDHAAKKSSFLTQIGHSRTQVWIHH